MLKIVIYLSKNLQISINRIKKNVKNRNISRGFYQNLLKSKKTILENQNFFIKNSKNYQNLFKF